MWRGGCIIKSVFLADITKAFQKDDKLENLLFDDLFVSPPLFVQGQRTRS